MFFIYSLLLFVLNVYMFCESAAVDNFQKCHVRDQQCLKTIMHDFIVSIAEEGDKNLGLPPIDPMIIQNMTVSVPDVLDITLIDGQVKGVKKAIIDKFDVNLEDRRLILELTCDLSIKGRYKMSSSSPLIRTLLGADTGHGEGNGKVKIEKLKLRFEFLFNLEKRNGDIYSQCQPEKTKYNFDIKGKMKFFADNIYIGDKESSKIVVGILNENYRSFMPTIGKIIDQAVPIFYVNFHKFFDGVSLNKILLDDLNKYL